MQIAAVRVLRLRGTMLTAGPFWEERLARPIDIYPEYRVRDDFEGGAQVELTPLQEYLVKWNAINQHFLAYPLVPEGGVLRVPAQPGLGMAIDPAKIEAQEEV
jgi:hypothetical protein